MLGFCGICPDGSYSLLFYCLEGFDSNKEPSPMFSEGKVAPIQDISRSKHQSTEASVANSLFDLIGIVLE